MEEYRSNEASDKVGNERGYEYCSSRATMTVEERNVRWPGPESLLRKFKV